MVRAVLAFFGSDAGLLFEASMHKSGLLTQMVGQFMSQGLDSLTATAVAARTLLGLRDRMAGESRRRGVVARQHKLEYERTSKVDEPKLRSYLITDPSLTGMVGYVGHAP